MGAAQNSDKAMEDVIAFVSNIISKVSGNVLGKDQRSMVETRLQKRMLDLGRLTPHEYLEFINANYERETGYLISLLTTHHTFFFREFIHFEKLAELLPGIIERAKSRGNKKIRVWSAACSRGQEVYSLAMFLAHHMKSYPEMEFEILGTDIDPQSVKYGKNGVYLYKEVKGIPSLYLSGNWQKGSGDISHFAKVKKHIKERVAFRDFNLIDSSYSSFNNFDVVFCRNVFIYFEPETISRVVNNIKGVLVEGGLLFTGLSESLNSLDVKKNNHGPSIYSFTEFSEKVPSKSSTVNKTISSPRSQGLPKPIKMLLVDDSKSVLKILNRIFDADQDFKVVGTAENGVEAEAFLKANSVDAMTLDIHMPELDGVEYLKRNYNSKHPKVVMVSSASREDNRYAQAALDAGACDFVEKPSLQNIQERADEIKMKLKMAFLTSPILKNTETEIIRTNFVIENCAKKARVLFCSLSSAKKVVKLLKELEGNQPPVLIFTEGNQNSLALLADALSEVRAKVYSEGTSLVENEYYVCDLVSHYEQIFKENTFERKSLGVLGLPTEKLKELLSHESNVQLLLEDVGVEHGEISELASDIFPVTSFSHVGTEYLAKD